MRNPEVFFPGCGHAPTLPPTAGAIYIMREKEIVFVVGPTASGKSDVAMVLALKLGGEIISCDSMQIYREIHIASNKPSGIDMARVPHHLVDILSVREEFDVAEFNRRCLAAIDDVQGRGRVPIIVGGSGMYMQVLLDGIFQGGVKNESLRRDLKNQARQYGNQFLYDKLKEVDPQAAAKIHSNDLRRVIRALEISMTQEIPISRLQKDREGLWGKYNIRLFALNHDRPSLYDRINARVEEMFARGIVDEVRGLENAQWGRTAGKIIGIQEIHGFLRGQYKLEEAKEMIKLNTRRLAKRQLTWFRRDKRLEWVEMPPQASARDTAEILFSKLSERRQAPHL